MGADITPAGLARTAGHADANTPENLGMHTPPAAGKDTHYSAEPSRFKNRGWLLIKNKLVLASFTSATSAEERALIASACQSHAALVEALEELLMAHENCDETGYVDGVGFMRGYDHLPEKARAALALAKGGAQ